MNKQLVFERNGQLYVRSSQLAEVFKCSPAEVLFEIFRLDCTNQFRREHFKASLINGTRGLSGPEELVFDMTREGFEKLAPRLGRNERSRQQLTAAVGVLALFEQLSQAPPVHVPGPLEARFKAEFNAAAPRSKSRRWKGDLTINVFDRRKAG